MTIAIGFMTGDGVILCTDSHEIIGDYSKTTVQKIMPVDFGKWRLAIAGATDATHYLELFQEELARQLHTIETFDYDKIKNGIRSVLLEIHKEHIWPRVGIQPTLHMLIALQGIDPPSRGLLIARETAVTNVREYESIGIGAHMANAVKERLFQLGQIYNTPTHVIANYGIYILWHVKKAIEGCDGYTLVAVLRDGQLRFLWPEEVSDIEHVVEKLYPNQYRLLTALFNPTVDEQGVANHSAAFANAMTIMKRELIHAAERRKRFRESLKTMQPQNAQTDGAKPSTSQKSKRAR